MNSILICTAVTGHFSGRMQGRGRVEAGAPESQGSETLQKAGRGVWSMGSLSCFPWWCFCFLHSDSCLGEHCPRLLSSSQCNFSHLLPSRLPSPNSLEFSGPEAVLHAQVKQNHFPPLHLAIGMGGCKMPLVGTGMLRMGDGLSKCVILS